MIHLSKLLYFIFILFFIILLNQKNYVNGEEEWKNTKEFIYRLDYSYERGSAGDKGKMIMGREETGNVGKEILLIASKVEIFENNTNRVVEPTEVYLHHILGRISEPSLICMGSHHWNDRIWWAAAQGTQIIKNPYPYAVTSKSDSRWFMDYHFDLLTNEAIDFYVLTTLTYIVKEELTQQQNNDFRLVYPLFVDIMACQRGSAITIPGGGGVYSRSGTITCPFKGLLRYAYGHVHRGGINVELSKQQILHSDKPHAGIEQTGEQKILCNAEAEYPPIETLDEDRYEQYPTYIGRCFDIDEHFEIGDLIGITGVYDNKKRINEAMALFMAYAEIEDHISLHESDDDDDNSGSSSDSSSNDNSGGLSTGLKVSIVMAVLVVLVVSIFGIVFGYRYWKNKHGGDVEYVSTLEDNEDERELI